MAEVGTIGIVHHFNLVRLYGFCFERNLRALVYEFMGNGSLDRFLFSKEKMLGFEKLHEIAVGTARGIAYLHEEFTDFGLAKLINRENTDVTMTGGRTTPGYAAPELWMPFPITHKCDVHSYGMLLFEISQEWFPRWVWKKFEFGELGDLMICCGTEEKDKEIAERMVKVALLCVQHSPQVRPMMSIVVKMLEGAVEIPNPSSPFEYMTGLPCPVQPAHSTQTSSFLDSDWI
ncbi:hypothetical protein UlMin_004447 [Ulmus minor]